MTFPVIASKSMVVDAGSQTSHDVTMPTGVASGDLLILILAQSQSVRTPNTGGVLDEYTLLRVISQGSATGLRVYYKFADSTEANFNISTSTEGSCTGIQHLFRITSAHASTAPEASTGVGGGVFEDFDPDSLNPSGWGTEDTLWLACGATSGEDDITAAPTSYTSEQDGSSGTTNTDINSMVASRELNAASEDPGAFTPLFPRTSAAITMSIRPAAAAAGGIEIFRRRIEGY